MSEPAAVLRIWILLGEPFRSRILRLHGTATPRVEWTHHWLALSSVSGGLAGSHARACVRRHPRSTTSCIQVSGEGYRQREIQNIVA